MMSEDKVMQEVDGYSDWKRWDATEFGRFSVIEEKYFEKKFGQFLSEENSPILQNSPLPTWEPYAQDNNRGANGLPVGYGR